MYNLIIAIVGTVLSIFGLEYLSTSQKIQYQHSLLFFLMSVGVAWSIVFVDMIFWIKWKKEVKKEIREMVEQK